MRRLVICLMIGAVALLAACGGPQTQSTAETATGDLGTAASLPESGTAASEIATSIGVPDTGTAASEIATAISMPEVGTSVSEAATTVSGPDSATAMADVSGALSAVADDVTVRQGEQLILDATQSAGNIADYKWTITKAPTGAESVVGRVINEGSSGNVTLDPNVYTTYFPMAGNYTVQLTVTDAQGQTSSDDFTIDVP